MTFECFVQFPVSLELIVDALGPKRILDGNPSFEHLKFVSEDTESPPSHIIKSDMAQNPVEKEHNLGPST